MVADLSFYSKILFRWPARSSPPGSLTPATSLHEHLQQLPGSTSQRPSLSPTDFAQEGLLVSSGRYFRGSGTRRCQSRWGGAPQWRAMATAGRSRSPSSRGLQMMGITRWREFTRPSHRMTPSTQTSATQHFRRSVWSVDSTRACMGIQSTSSTRSELAAVWCTPSLRPTGWPMRDWFITVLFLKIYFCSSSTLQLFLHLFLNKYGC